MAMYMTKEAAERRDDLIFGKDVSDKYKIGGTASFGYRTSENPDGIDYHIADALVDYGFLDPDDKQNEAPTAGEFIEFCKNHPNIDCRLLGYAVSPQRNDCRVSIEGLKCKTDDSQFFDDFVRMFSDADEYEVDEYDPWDHPGEYYFRCWYD